MKKNIIVWFLGLGLVISLLGVWGIKSYLDRPQNLGNELEYLGKSDYGCYIVCDAPPGSTYFFGTNLTKEGLKKYFVKAQYVDLGYEPGGGGAGGLNTHLKFKTNNRDDFYVSFYEDAEEARSVFHLNHSSKKNIIAISNFDFLIAKDSLE